MNGSLWSPPLKKHPGSMTIEPGTLTRDAKYLHHRTGGGISSLSHLIRQAAISAILLQTERIDRDLLDATIIDHAAEMARPRPSATTRRGP